MKHCIRYWTRGFKKSERSYITTERECLVVVWAGDPIENIPRRKQIHPYDLPRFAAMDTRRCRCFTKIGALTPLSTGILI